MGKSVSTLCFLVLSFGFTGTGIAEETKEITPGLHCKYLIAPVVLKSEKMCGANRLCVTPIRCVGEGYSVAAGKFITVKEPIFGQASCAANENETCPDITKCYVRSQKETRVSLGAEPEITERSSISFSSPGIHVDRTTHDKDDGKK